MWKAVIKWVESWSYRCKHEWVKEDELRVYNVNKPDVKIPASKIYLYRCEKCCEFKSHTI